MCRLKTASIGRDRQGATAVEFAFAAPLLFLIVFGLIEISRLYVIHGAVTTALLKGAREASIVTSTPETIRDEIRSFLAKVGANDFSLTITPDTLTESTPEVTVALELPLAQSNGFVVTRFVNGKSIKRTLTRQRTL